MRYSAVYVALHSKIYRPRQPAFEGLNLASYDCWRVYTSESQFDRYRDRRLYVSKIALPNYNNIGTVPFVGSKHTRELIRKINDEHKRKSGEK